MATDVHVRELSLLRQYKSQLKDAFNGKIQYEVISICRKLEKQIEKSVNEETELTRITNYNLENLRYRLKYIQDLKDRYHFGHLDRVMLENEIGERNKIISNIEENLSAYKRNHQTLRNEMEGVIRQLKAFGLNIYQQVSTASDNLKGQISTLEQYKNTH